MPEITKDQYTEWVETIVNKGTNLTTWEISFIESIQDRLRSGGYLSEKQIAIVEKMYAEKTP